MNRILAWVSLTVLTMFLFLAAGCSGGDSTSTHALSLDPNGLTVVAGEQVQLSPTCVVNGVPEESPQVTWNVTGGVGTVSETGLFTATSSVSSGAPIIGTIEASCGDGSISIPVTVTVGAVASLDIITPSGVDLNALPVGGTAAFTAEGEDALGNRGASRIPVTPTWSVEGNIGTIDATGLFTATAPGAGAVVATVGELSTEVPVTVVIGELASLEIEAPEGFNTQQVTVGDKATFTLVATNTNGVRKAGRVPVEATWSVTGGIGTITQNGAFTATNIGQGEVVATTGQATASLPIVVTSAFHGKIAFIRQDEDSNIWTITGNGSAQPLSVGDNFFCGPDWSPDGAHLIFTSQGQPLNGICIMGADGSSPSQLYASRGQDPVWSPDGSLIAYSNGLVAAGEICIIDSAGNFVKKVTAGAVGNPRHPCWSPDGSLIACSVSTGIGLTDGVYVVPVDGSTPARLIYSGQVNHLEWNPNYTYIAIATTHQILGLPVNGGQPVVLVEETDALNGGFAWSPDSSGIVYGVLVNGKNQLRVKQLSSGVTFPLTSGTDANSLSPTWTE